MLYRDMGRRFVLALKHADRPELAKQASRWMENAGRTVLTPHTAFVPVPIHWTRLLSRRYNQSAELARALAHGTGLDYLPDALCRNRRTQVQDGLTVEGRFENVQGAIRLHARREHLLRDRDICLIDDVMTSGATLAASARACRDAGARQISVLVLARVVKAP
jgi:predicted amidophosphoribosyltransferase